MAMIEKVREYIATCPYLKEYAELNVDYLTDTRLLPILVNENAQDMTLLSRKTTS